eukprot:946441-Prymnesium_polylepis.2
MCAVLIRITYLEERWPFGTVGHWVEVAGERLGLFPPPLCDEHVDRLCSLIRRTIQHLLDGRLHVIGILGKPTEPQRSRETVGRTKGTIALERDARHESIGEAGTPGAPA